MVACPFGSFDWVCNGQDQLCFDCATVRHDELHPNHDVADCRECKLASVLFSPFCRGQARNSLPPEGTADRNSWERGLARDERGMPYRDLATGAPITVKRFAENRSRFDESRRRNRAGVVV